ncbi:MAG TPA: hypothetical protein VFQ49_09195, partial [Actinomycetes bacterium]|nr:hypothetical protein [Actinomycetes bacterium]
MAEALPAALELVPAGPVALRLAAPASKSVTNRALLCAALADGASRLDGAAPSDDAEAMAAALPLLGARVDASSWTVTGTGGRLASPTRPLDARLSGTTMRFLAAAATLTLAGATVTGAPPLLRRPVGPLVAALRALGAEIRDQGGLPPVTAAGGGLDGGRATVDATLSSQFASAVLLVAPYARRTVVLTAERLGAAAYVELTAELMGRFGAAVELAGPAAVQATPGRGHRRPPALVPDPGSEGPQGCHQRPHRPPEQRRRPGDGRPGRGQGGRRGQEPHGRPRQPRVQGPARAGRPPPGPGHCPDGAQVDPGAQLGQGGGHGLGVVAGGGASKPAGAVGQGGAEQRPVGDALAGRGGQAQGHRAGREQLQRGRGRAGAVLRWVGTRRLSHPRRGRWCRPGPGGRPRRRRPRTRATAGSRARRCRPGASGGRTGRPRRRRP